jgi:hypothetical protein
MREKSMITMALYNNIINALKQTKGGKKTGINSKFYSWCKTHFKIDESAGVTILCSLKNGNRIVVLENYYQVRPPCSCENHLKLCFRFYKKFTSKQVMVVETKCDTKSCNIIIGFHQK